MSTRDRHGVGVGVSTAGRTVLEILPVLVDDGGVCYLSPRSRDSWRVPCGRGHAVKQVVRRRLASAGVRATVVHSTSWREERHAIVLTHLAVVDPRNDGDLRGFERRPVERRDPVRGTATAPPRVIDVEDVVEHALRHLAWLSVEDATVAAALGARWRESLRGYEPAPFCVFERDQVSTGPPREECGCGAGCACATAIGGTESCL